MNPAVGYDEPIYDFGVLLESAGESKVAGSNSFPNVKLLHLAEGCFPGQHLVERGTVHLATNRSKKGGVESLAGRRRVIRTCFGNNQHVSCTGGSDPSLSVSRAIFLSRILKLFMWSEGVRKEGGS